MAKRARIIVVGCSLFGCAVAQALSAAGHDVIVTIEDGVLDGGFGERVARALSCDDVRVRCYGLPRAFADRYDPSALLESCGMTAEGIVADVRVLLGA